MLLVLKLFNYFNFNTKSERWVMWLILKMHEMLISQGWSGSHLLKKPGRGLPDSGWSASGSGCCTGHLCGTSSGWILQNNCSWWFPWSVHWSGTCGYSWWFGCCWSNWCSSWGCWHWSHWKQPRWGLWCSWGYISAGQCVWLDSIWMTFMDVVMCMSVLASPMTWTKYESWWAWQMTVAGRQRVLASLSTETVCPAYSRDFSLQWWSWYAALWVAQSLRWSQSAAAWGSLCLILWGTVVLITLW